MLTNHSVNKIVVQSTALENSAVASTSATRGNHAYATDAVTIRGKKSTAASTGGNLWITGDTTVSGSSVAVEQVKFVDSAISTTNPTLELSAASDIAVKKDLVLSGKLSTAAGDLTIAPATGLVKVMGNLEVDGQLTTVNAVTTNVAVTEKIVSLANTDTATLASWAFNGDSPVDTQASLSMALTNATIANGVLTLPANGSASSAEADIGSALTGSYQIGFNIKAGAAALTVFRFCDSSLAGGIRLAVTSSGWVKCLSRAFRGPPATSSSRRTRRTASSSGD
eukprot:jgi/Mesvir1/9903/Mv18617-RA.1